jgi:hypothetical protein
VDTVADGTDETRFHDSVTDMWIAASAREHGLVLFTRDAHFQEVDGLLTASSVDQLLPQRQAAACFLPTGADSARWRIDLCTGYSGLAVGSL